MVLAYGESQPVSAWACLQCSSVHRDKADADACCTCSNCGQKFKKDGYETTCESCSYGTELRNVRANVERLRDHYNCERDRLERLIDNPPPGKNRPKLDAVPPRDDSYTHPDGTHDKSAWAPIYEVRDWLIDLSGTGSHVSLTDCKSMADKLTLGIKRTGGGDNHS